MNIRRNSIIGQLFRTKSISARRVDDDVFGEMHDERIGAVSEGADLSKVLSVRDLTAMGIAAIIGAGIFGTIGKASFDGGPAIIFLFIFTALACGFSAMSYARFASLAPVSGSAYTYAYVAFGELIAWIIGWDLLLEYAIGNIAVAISWSDYFTGLLHGINIHIPEYFSMDYLSAQRAFLRHDTANEGYTAWMNAPQIGGFRIIADLPALGITALITWLCYTGIKESRTAGNIMVLIKLMVILLVIAVGAFYVKPENWSDFAPNGFSGVMKGVSAVFFAYIGFDALSTTAEECKNPQRDLPRGMFYALLICTVLYVLIALVLTGMTSYTNLNVGDPLAHVFSAAGLNTVSGIVAVSAVVAIAGVLLVFQLGQPRIWMSMSRDGLLPKIFSRIHPKYKTPGFSTIFTGFLVAIPALFMNLTEVTDLTSIGTLFAFVLVNAGVLITDMKGHEKTGRFKIPYISALWGLVSILAVSLMVFGWIPGTFSTFFGIDDHMLHLREQHPSQFWIHLAPRILMVIVFFGLLILSWFRRVSLIPTLGLLCCVYLMAELTPENWERFLIWLGIGLIFYFVYGFRNSKLSPKVKS